MNTLKLHNEFDKSIIKEIKGTYGWTFQNKDNKREVVLDVGANFGAYSVYAYLQNVKKIYSYEPEPSNFELLSENTKDKKNIFIFNKALISGDEPEVMDFYLPKNRKNMGSCSLYVKNGRDKIQVETENFQKVLNKVKPTIIKMDCEGAEYDLLLNCKLPKSVKMITIELHFGKKEWRNDKVYKVIDIFKDWEEVKGPTITDVNWHTIVKYKR